ncbi:MAG: tRNA pseudouridine(55) synthase TruB [Oscillospiraceae bacterium]|nr:tRNA pseudouridine(55) synthase TruB [Oscillospiraceae bacterium]
MNGIICIDKPQNYTSFDIVAIMRKIFKTKKIGHGGTLDPMATGVLPLFIGNATRAVDFQPSNDKEYLAGFKFGLTSDTQDITGKILTENNTRIPPEKLSVIKKYTGEIEQIPPMFSAVQIGGKRLYELAREGKEIERKPRKITIRDLKIEEYKNNSGVMRVFCSKGTYIRTLIHDIGQELGAGAVMTSLIRTRTGNFTLEDCYKIDDLQTENFTSLQKLLTPLEKFFSCYPKCLLDKEQTRLVTNGVKLDAGRVNFEKHDSELYTVYTDDMVLIGLANLNKENTLEFTQKFQRRTVT